MSTCKDCLHYDACGGFTPTDLDADVFDYCRKGNTDEIPDIEERCGSFKNKADYAPVVHCCDCIFKRESQDIYNTCYLSCNKNWGLRGVVDPTDFCSYGERKESEVRSDGN